jgi:hypothetical protein
VRDRRQQERSTTEPTVFLHIGTPKSGTTYLQSRFAANDVAAREQGLLWPGPRWGAHVEAVRNLRTLKRGQRLQPDGPWLRFADQAREWPGPKVLISMEWLTGCSPPQVEFAVKSLQPVRVEIVCTARDLLRSFPAQWQEMTKNRHPWSWRQFVDEIVNDDGEGPAQERFWNQQDVPGVLRKWAQEVPWDRIHLVTVPPSGSDAELLWTRFCSVLGIDGSGFAQPRKDNESLGVVSAALMHRVNLAALARDVAFDDYQRIFHLRLADQVLAPRRGQEGGFGVSPEVDAWVRRRAERLVDDLRSLDVDVVGDLAELLPGEPLIGREPDDVTPAELLDTGVVALVGLAMNQYAAIRELHERNQDLRHRLARLRGEQEPTGT